MTCSTNFRRKVLEIKEREGLSFEKAAVRFGVGKSGMRRWTWMERLEPARKRNKPAAEIDMALLEQDVELHPDAYRHELPRSSDAVGAI